MFRTMEQVARRASGSGVLALVLALSLLTPADARNRGSDGDTGPGRGEASRAERCDVVPDPPGEARGIARHCPPRGSSGGIAKGDFNGDGFTDLAVGVPGENIVVRVTLTATQSASVVRFDAGAVNVIYGSPNGLAAGGAGVPASQFLTQGQLGIAAEVGAHEDNDRFGAALAAGDFNHDGFSELAIAAPGETVGGVLATGVVHVLLGTSAGLTTQGNRVFDLGNLGRTREAGARFGEALTWGDFNCDEIGDLAIGTSGVTAGTAFRVGAVHTLSGSPNGLVPQSLRVISGADVGVALPSEGAAIGFGSNLAAADFNGDACTDIALGAFQEELLPGILTGAAHVVYGSRNGLAVGTHERWSQTSTNIQDESEHLDNFGKTLAAGDFNNDSFADLAIGVPGEDLTANPTSFSATSHGAVNVLYGSAQGLTAGGGATGVPVNQFWTQDSPDIADAAEQFDGFGLALASGDFNGDAFADLAIGVPLEDLDGAGGGVENAGAVNVLYGSAQGLTAGGGGTGAPADQFWHQNRSGVEDEAERDDHFGSALTAWNFGRGTQTDLAIGVVQESVVSSTGTNVLGAGAVNVLYGSQSGLDSSGDQLWHQGVTGVGGLLETSDGFGRALY